MEKETECPCKKPDCLYHGDCVACFKNHESSADILSCMRMGNGKLKKLQRRVLARLKTAGLLDGSGTDL